MFGAKRRSRERPKARFGSVERSEPRSATHGALARRPHAAVAAAGV